jgi:hypothetical protein
MREPVDLNEPKSKMKTFMGSSVRVFLYPCIAIICFWGFARCGFSAERPRFRSVEIHNTEPRRDINGKIMDAHDGGLQFFNGHYYLYGTAYGKTAGYSFNNRFRVYSSPDLEHWSFEGELFKAPPDGVYYNPRVVYNSNTHKYVFWYSWFPKLWNGQDGVAISDTPVGPFTIVNSRVPLPHYKDRIGAAVPFVDDDGTGYVIYDVIGQNHALLIERLTRDFLSPAGQGSEILGHGVEAPDIFRYHNRYYLLFDKTCCFCPAGSGAHVFIASAPLVPMPSNE